MSGIVSAQFPRRPYRTKRAGSATVEVYRLSDGAYMGLVWRTRTGYSAVNADGDLVADDSRISRDTTIRCLLYRQGENEEAK